MENYTLIITNVENGCYSEQTYAVTDPGVDPLEVVGEVATPSCFLSNDASIDLTVSQGAPPYTFLWSNNTQDEDVVNLSAGTYTVTVTDDNDCSSVAEFVVEETSMIEISGNITNVFCNDGLDGIIDLDVVGGVEPYNYNWSSGEDTPEIFDLASGDYIVTVTDANGCTEVDFFVVEEPIELLLTFNTECPTGTSDGSIDVIVNGGTAPYQYEWSNGFQTQTINNLTTGIYSITITDANACTVVGEIELGTTIEQLTGGDITYCDNDQVQLEVIAPNAVSYEWSVGNLSCYDCSNPIATVGLGEETFYSVTVTEADGCIDIGYISFSVQSYLDFNLLEFSNSPVYAGQDIEFDCNVPNASSINWIGPNGFQSSDCNPIISNGTSGEGLYSLDIIDQYGCAANASTDVVVYDIIEFISNDTFICQGDSVQLEVIAPTAVSVIWTPTTTLDDPNSATPFARPGSSTVYIVTVEDINGFSESASVLVEVTELPVLVNVVPVSVCEGGELVLIADPGNLPGDYLWTWPSGTSTDHNIAVIPMLGECFTLTYTAPNGCFYEDEICVEEFSEIMVTETVVEDTVCRTESIVLSFDTDASQTIANVEWSPSNIIDGDIATLLETTTFSVTITEQTGCTGSTSFDIVVDQSCVWPGDTDSTYVVNNFDLLNIGLGYDSIGPVRSNASLFWGPQPAESWTQSTPDGVNYKFIDCDGNGVINSEDTLGITQNWGEVHNFTGDDDIQFFGPNYPQSGMTVTVPFYVEPDTLIENESYALPIILGEPGNEAEDVYGLAFTLEYDSAVIVPGSASIGIDGWLGTLNSDMISIQKTFISPGVVDVGITRIDGTPMNGFGQLGVLYITIEDDVLLRLGNDNRDDDAIEVSFNITNVIVIDNLGQEIPVVPMATSTVLEETVSTNDINWDEYIQVAPNPVNEFLYLATKNIKIEAVKLYSINGKLLIETTLESSAIEISTSHLNSGMYLLEVQTDLGVMVERVVVMR